MEICLHAKFQVTVSEIRVSKEEEEEDEEESVKIMFYLYFVPCGIISYYFLHAVTF